MKNFALLICFIAYCIFSGCSKSGNPAPANVSATTHTIKITASGTDAINTVVNVTKSGQTSSTAVDTKTTLTGAYNYSTTLSTGDIIDFSLMTAATNTVNYSISDNGAVVAQETSKDLGMYTKITASYTVK